MLIKHRCRLGLLVSALIYLSSCQQPATFGDLRYLDRDPEFFGSSSSYCSITAAYKSPRTSLALSESSPSTYHTDTNIVLESNSAYLLSQLARLVPSSSTPKKPSAQDHLRTVSVLTSEKTQELLLSRPDEVNLAYSLAIQGVPLCDFSAKLISLPGQTPLSTGESLATVLAELSPHLEQTAALIADGTLSWKEDLSQWEAVLKQAEISAAAELHQPPPDVSAIRLYASQRCLFRSSSGLVPGWKLSAYFTDRRPYEVTIRNQQLSSVLPRYFHAQGHARVYEYGKTDAYRTLPIENMHGNGFLCSDMLTTTVPSSYGVAFNPGLIFNYPPEDFRFQETSAFANVAEMFEWFKNLNPAANWAQAPVEIYLTDEPQYLRAGPSYENPEFRNLTRPRIIAPLRLDQNNKPLLVNLASDGDALPHELGHHILFEFVGISSQEEHRILHEAIADAFVFFKNADPCLAETICTPGASLCTFKNQQSCLRSADNTLNYLGNEYQQDLAGNAHARSQLITGLLWDLHRSYGLSLQTLATLLYKAISYLPRETDFNDFLLALQVADSKLNKGENACTISDAAIKRGLEAKLSPIDCSRFSSR